MLMKYVGDIGEQSDSEEGLREHTLGSTMLLSMRFSLS